MLSALLIACAPSGSSGLCGHFVDELETVPHAVLSVDHGTYRSVWDQLEYRGCEVRFETSESLRAGVPIPDFEARRDSELYHRGWRASRGIGADGPGSGIFGIEGESALCIIRWTQPAYIDEDGELVQSETFGMTIQCRGRTP